MAVTYMTGFEAQEGNADLAGLQGTAAYSTTQHRTGAASVRCNPASGASGNVSGITAAGWVHFGLYVASLPGVERQIDGITATPGEVEVRLNSSGALAVYINSVLQGTSSAQFATPGWHWVGIRHKAGTSVVLLQIDGADQVSGTTTFDTSQNGIGFLGNESTAVDAYFDDFIFDGAGFLPPSSVNLLVPTADSAKGTGWTNDAAATTNLFDAVDNKPPAGIADTTVGSGLHQLRNATANASVNYDATMTTYAAAGLTPQDTVLAVQPVIATAAPVTTSSKQGTVGVASNPTITNVALGSGGTAGAFWSGTAAGTYPTGWKISQGTLTTSPTVTVATAPVMRVTQVTSSTRIAMVCFMGIYVAWTPGALGVIDEPGVFPGRGPRNVNQGINRASSY